MTDRDLDRRNLRWALALFALFVFLFAATFGVALLYLAFD